ncbi:MAG: hypothetical protein ACJZ9B_02650 [Coraliomargaritaceae bacterium]
MRNYTFYLILFTISLLVSLQANEDHIHLGHKHYGHESSQLMFAYQIGYAEIHSKNNHMSDDSGALLGVHLMKHIQSKALENKLFLAAGAHTVFTNDKHIGVMLGIMYQLNEDTMLSIMPGLMYMKHAVAHSHGGMQMSMEMQMPMTHSPNPEWETEKVFHIEISRSINLFNHKLTPSLGWMSSSSHDQYSFGLNFHI